ncbi:YgjP-like metallopeptidase domain-containing protein [Mycoplasma zalophidermidis]|uniref:M48 family metallopeptidase n=1 Tax=Mycoplasma zalophidermidis TaxID=398174 RepID=A0ABS6DS75_9MOLU|nr:YgjP-like metallopeptidase domain-containing protein [Mycoplasma zalophidermidis]MBU4690039.1 M48 family metallopeptidase [Mycoplasma zalophidermidis]MBU4693289.1 M48 family metallopeptidase [Mycoplasma zalophidermidis]MCR8966415.1 M48 family metallopeptidase [Mycoplasma zalophidermidis]
MLENKLIDIKLHPEKYKFFSTYSLDSRNMTNYVTTSYIYANNIILVKPKILSKFSNDTKKLTEGQAILDGTLIDKILSKAQLIKQKCNIISADLNNNSIYIFGNEYNVLFHFNNSITEQLFLDKSKNIAHFWLKNNARVNREIRYKKMIAILSANLRLIITKIQTSYEKLLAIDHIPFKIQPLTSIWGRYKKSLREPAEIKYNLTLIGLGIDFINAVVVHELTHHFHKNHDREFRNAMYKLDTNSINYDKKLKEYTSVKVDLVKLN